MNELTRRQALSYVSSAGLFTIATCSADAKEDQPAKPGQKHQLFVVGPFRLGEWYKKEGKERLKRDWFLKGAGITWDDLIRALTKNRVFIIDQRITNDSNRAKFAYEGYPVATIEGELLHEWKNAKTKREFSVQISELRCTAPLTNEDASPPFREVKVNYFLSFKGALALGTQLETVGYVPSMQLRYDIIGMQVRSEDRSGD